MRSNPPIVGDFADHLALLPALDGQAVVPERVFAGLGKMDFEAQVCNNLLTRINVGVRWMVQIARNKSE